MNKFIKYYNKFVNIFYGLGIISIYYNKQLHQFRWNCCSCIYPILLLLVNFFGDIFIYTNSASIRKPIDYLTDIYNISMLIHKMTVTIVYYLFVLNSIQIGKQQATFLNEIFNFDVKVRKQLNITIDNANCMQRKLFALMCNVCFHIGRTAYFNFFVPKNWHWIQITQFLQGILVQLFIYYATNCMSFLNLRFAVISHKLCSPQIKIKHDKDTINALIGLYDELIDLKDLFNEIFSTQILLFMFFNFSIFTTTIYFMVIMFFDGYTVRDVCTLGLWIIPQIFCIGYFFKTFSQFDEQRVKIKRVISTLMTKNNDMVWVYLILFSIKIKQTNKHNNLG